LLVVVTDVFGFSSPNPRLLADSVASALNIRTVVPDLFKGRPLPLACMQDIFDLTDKSSTATFGSKVYSFGRLLSNFIPFVFSHSHAEGGRVVSAVCKALVEEDESITQIVLAGYCWGGNIATKLAQMQGADAIKGLTSVYTAHAGGLKIPRDYELVRIPICVVIAQLDFEVKEKQQQVIRETMEKRKGELVSEVHVVQDVVHGFAMRGSKDDPIINEKRQQAEKMLTDFIILTCKLNNQ